MYLCGVTLFVFYFNLVLSYKSLTEVEKVCGNDIFAVMQDKVRDPDGVLRQKIYVFFAMESHDDADEIERYLNENNYTFIMADDVPFCD